MSGEFFEYHYDLPDNTLSSSAKYLVGFDERFKRLRRELELLAISDSLLEWSSRYYGQLLRICQIVAERYPLIIFVGDVGTGKTATARAMSSLISQELQLEGHLYALSTRVRGAGKVGQASSQINDAFDEVSRELGKRKLCFLIVDEADSLVSSRDQIQSHHEDKVAVNTIIQKVDDLRRHGGRFVVLLCTNRGSSMDPAVLRRAARIETFERPNDQERRQLLEMDCQGLSLDPAIITSVVENTGPNGDRLGFTFSDLRTRLLPEALSYAFPDRKLTGEDLLEATRKIKPSAGIIQ